MIGRTFEVNQADLQASEKDKSAISYRKFKFVVCNVEGNQAIGMFNGVELTTDKQRSINRRWHKLIEAICDVKTQEGFELRFVINAITKRDPAETKKTCYAKQSLIKGVRNIMIDTIIEKYESMSIDSIVKLIMSEKVENDIVKKCVNLLPIDNCHVMKINVLKRPKSFME